MQVVINQDHNPALSLGDLVQSSDIWFRRTSSGVWASSEDVSGEVFWAWPDEGDHETGPADARLITAPIISWVCPREAGGFLTKTE